MKHSISLLICLSLSTFLSATPPLPPRTLVVETNEFIKLSLPRFERFTRDLRARLSPTKSPRRAELLENLDACFRVLREEDGPRVQRALAQKADRRELADALRSLHTNLADLRRSVDELLVESLAEKSLRVDERFFDELRQFWLFERGYSLRFRFDPNETVETTAEKILAPAK